MTEWVLWKRTGSVNLYKGYLTYFSLEITLQFLLYQLYRKLHMRKQVMSIAVIDRY